MADTTGYDAPGAGMVAAGGFDKRLLAGIIGILLMVIGTFLPIVTISAGSEQASMNYYGNGTGDGWLILIFAALAAVMLFMKNYNRLRIAGAVSLIWMAIDFFRLMGKSSEITALGASLGFSWGWLFLIGGAVLLILTPMFGPKEY